VIIQTTNFINAKREINKTLGKRGMLAVFGEKGAGKTFIKRQIIGAMQEKTNRYKVVEICPIESESKNITQIMSAMISDISSEGPKRDTEARRRQLRRILGEASENYEIILAVDEAQDLHKSTIRGIKKLHELGFGLKDHLFTVIFFGQNSLKDKISDDELRPRIKRFRMQNLTQNEKKKFIDDPSIFSKEALDIFIRRTRPLPLAVTKAFWDLLDMKEELEVKHITKQHAEDYFSIDLRSQILGFGKSFRQLSNEIEAVTGQKISPTALNQASKGKYNGSMDKIQNMINDYEEEVNTAKAI